MAPSRATRACSGWRISARRDDARRLRGEPSAPRTIRHPHAVAARSGRARRPLAVHRRGRARLHVRGQLNLAVRRARELAALIADGAVDGLSIGFRTEKARPERGLRRLVEADLWEISLVTFPMLPGARVERKGTPALSRGERELALAIRRASARLRRHPSTHRQPTRTR